MSQLVLICESNPESLDSIRKILKDEGRVVLKASDKKEVKNFAEDNPLEAVILDFQFANNSVFETLSYLKIEHPSTKIIMSYSAEYENLLSDLKSDEEGMKSLGVLGITKKPYNKEEINSLLGQKFNVESQAISSQEELSILDKEFSTIKINNFYFDNIAIFDLYLRISEAKYIKVFHKGTIFSIDEINRYKQEKGIDYLYFKTNDRKSYVSHLNDFLEKTLKKNNLNTIKALKITEGLIGNYVNELYFQGISEELLDEADKICTNTYDLLRRDRKIATYLDDFQNIFQEGISRAFLTTVFSSLIASNLEWANRMTHDFVVKGALLHDLGKLDLPENIRTKNLNELDPEEQAIFKTHPEKGLEILSTCNVSQQVKQIVYQHHELVNGEGYPNGLFGMRIFPLAKVVTFASDFSKFIYQNKLSPLDGLKHFIPDRTIVCRYDSACIKAFIKSFARSKSN